MIDVLRKNRSLAIIILLGVIVRFLFLFFGAELYYGKTNFFIGGDTLWWVSNIKNLIENGAYTDALDNEWGYFTRTPGYSFFIGFFFLFTGKEILPALKMVVIAQSVLDVFSIYLVYRIALKIFFDNRIALFTALLYALYPFIIVWNAVVYAESLSIFLFLLSINLLLKSRILERYLLAGIIFSLAVLTRIQLIIFIPLFLALVAYQNKKFFSKWINANVVAFALAILVVYGSWPLRNLVLHGKPVFAQHLGDRAHWSPDYMYFMYYIWAVKTDHEPQLTQILSGEEVDFPAASFKNPEDKVLLDSVVQLTRTCGEGFSYFSRTAGYRNEVVQRKDACNDEIVAIFSTLIANQKKFNPINYYLLVPLSNLNKAIFKSSLLKPSNSMVYSLGKLIFAYRTIMIILGLAGLLLIFIRHRMLFFSPGILIVSLYAISWYLFQSFIYRNMEIRYLLHADVLLLIPAAYLLSQVYFHLKPKSSVTSNPGELAQSEQKSKTVMN